MLNDVPEFFGLTLILADVYAFLGINKYHVTGCAGSGHPRLCSAWVRVKAFGKMRFPEMVSQPVGACHEVAFSPLNRGVSIGECIHNTVVRDVSPTFKSPSLHFLSSPSTSPPSSFSIEYIPLIIEDGCTAGWSHRHPKLRPHHTRSPQYAHTLIIAFMFPLPGAHPHTSDDVSLHPAPHPVADPPCWILSFSQYRSACWFLILT